MNFLNDFLPIILYIAGIVLLVILIIIGIRVIRVMDNVDDIVKDVDYKVKSLNGLFHIIDVTADKLATINDRLVEGVSNFILKLFKKKYNKKEEENKDE